ncbi:hypothetical protein [Nonomuraea candida]|uniref:hypothetical protein n=1 Tax=Nonomuraea candida TaxID=359159 RepID=UPI0005BD5B7B|nr:hypothetical protein [Nonomuraea candida]
MTPHSPDDATRDGGPAVSAVEGLLALARSRPRWAVSAALGDASEAIARSRALAGRSPGRYTPLLARCLRTTAELQLERGRGLEALPLAQEAVALTRALGGGDLVVSLICLARAQEAVRRYGEAAATYAEAEKLATAD